MSYKAWLDSQDINYFLDVVRISAPTFLRVLTGFALTGLTLVGAAAWANLGTVGWILAFALMAAGVALLSISLAGLYRFYGPPARRDHQQIIEFADLANAQTIAEFHLGTYRHTRLFAALLPTAIVHSIDCWNESIDPEHGRLQKFRKAELPLSAPNIVQYTLPFGPTPLTDASCDVVLFGIGFHEFTPSDRQRLFNEAVRLLKPGGKIIVLEHIRNIWNLFVFGPEIGHWLRRQEWMALLQQRFGQVKHRRISMGIDAFTVVVESQEGNST